ncbi:hypothetical protein HBA54_10350 [Pelagibius litoralis]|uniref:Uncharacterized protein n=1 Tax=Pelagibius litoralis TaxID=374515 RepID=A0A967C3B2_9PROT|nr:hypothetical protein [Pelagibius litoralis]NIA68993.1 hypothetical protein [Pelagibius litoralis]
MTVIDFQAAAIQHRAPAVRLDLDDLVLRGSEELGLEVDTEGYLVLTEGEDFD